MTRAPCVAALVAASALVLAACAGTDGPSPAEPGQPPAWNHDPADDDLGPEGWGRVDASFDACLEGDEQSPIDIAETEPADLPPLEFDYADAPLVVENTGHVIEVAIPEDAEQALSIGDDMYTLVQYHVHAPSEHTLAGVEYDVEVHFVHRNDEDEIAVVGVLLDQAAPPTALLDAIMTNAPAESGEEVEVDEERSPLELLPVGPTGAEISRYFTYPGSLTTPGCAEGVRWFVLKDTLGASAPAVDRLHDLIAAFPGYDGYEHNDRPTQPLNDREVQSGD